MKTYDLDETGKAHVFRDMQLRNRSDKDVDLSIAQFVGREENTNLVNLKVEDEPKTNFVKHQKNVSGLHTEIVISSEKILSPQEEYKLKAEYDLPNYATRLNNSFIVNEIFQRSLGIDEGADEFHIIYKIPKMYQRLFFWKELHVVASNPSRRYTEDDKQILEYTFNLRKGSKELIRFVYRVQTRSVLYPLLTFLLGFFAEKILEFLWNIGLAKA